MFTKLATAGLTTGSALLAQTTPTDPLMGSTGWIGAGLLGLVLAWLLFVHLPNKDKQLKELLTAKDDQINTLLEKKWQAIEKITDSAGLNLQKVTESTSANLKTVLENGRAEVTQITAILQRELDRAYQVRRDTVTPTPLK